MFNKVVVTGATGFVGKALFTALNLNPAFEVTGLCRTLPTSPELEGFVALGSLETSDFTSVLQNVDVVIHSAARAHVGTEAVWKSLSEFRRVNVEGTINLARQAAKAGARRFVFISSIGVNGGSTNENAFTEQDLPKPHTPYAQSKLEAEAALHTLCQENRMELVIIRPPLIYAAHAPGNFEKLLKIVAKQVPLPFSLVKNKRSFIALENAVDFIILCTTHPKAANETFLIADNEYLSTSELCRLLGSSMGKSSIMLPVPVFLMKWMTKILGKQAMFEQLSGSLIVDNSKSKAMLNWQPPLTATEALKQTGQQYISLE